ncbi:MAG: wax ester/triacylglycerol synthase family O-acyltransferase [Acidimicrobiales bacterium]
MTDLSAVEHFEFEPRMSDADALMWSIEKDPLLRSTITFVTLLDQAPDRERFTRVMDRASRVVPRLRQRVLGHPYSIAPPRWEVDPNFDLDYHLRWMRTIDEGTVREVFEIAEPIAMQGFDRARPLWEFTVVEGLADGKAAIIGKVHHAITDGVGGMKLQMEMLDLERHPATEREMPPAPLPHELGESRRVVDAVRYEAERQLGSARGMLASAVDRARRLAADPVGVGVDAVRTTGSIARLLSPATKPLSPLMVDRSLSVHFDTLRLPLGEMKAAARIVQGRLNDAFVAGVAGGLRHYHEHHGYSVDALRMTMPINIRDDETANRAGNQFVPARFPVPVGIDDPLRRMNAVRELVAQQRAEPALSLTDPIAGILNRLPVSATTAVFGSMLKGVDFITSNVPGAPLPVFVAGAAVEAQIALGPMTGAACNVVLLSYQDDVNLGVTMDPAAIPDHDVFMDCLRDGFAEITKLA